MADQGSSKLIAELVHRRSGRDRSQMSMFPENDQHPMDNAANGEWRDCKSGEIHNMVRAQRLARQRRQLSQASFVGVSFLVLLSVVIWSIPNPLASNERAKGGVTCAEVIDQAEDFIAGRLAQAIREKFDIHLSKCPSCLRHFDSLRDQEVSIGGAADEIAKATIVNTAQNAVAHHQSHHVLNGFASEPNFTAIIAFAN